MGQITSLFGTEHPYSQVRQPLLNHMVRFFDKETCKAFLGVNTAWNRWMARRSDLWLSRDGLQLNGRVHRYRLVEPSRDEEASSLLALDPTCAGFWPNRLGSVVLYADVYGGLVRVGQAESDRRYVALTVGSKSIEDEKKLRQVLGGLRRVLLPNDTCEVVGVPPESYLFQVYFLSDRKSIKTLSEKLRNINDPVLQLQVLTYLAREILEALSAMHERNYYHLNVSAENIMIDARGKVVIGNLDDAQHSPDGMVWIDPTNEAVRDLTRLPPEVQRGTEESRHAGAKIDAWGAAFVLLELVAPRFKAEFDGSPESLVSICVRALYASIGQEVEHKKPFAIYFVALLYSLLDAAPQTRPSVAEALKRPCLRTISGDPATVLGVLVEKNEILKPDEVATAPRRVVKKMSDESQSLRELTVDLEPLPSQGSSMPRPTPFTPPPLATYVHRQSLVDFLTNALLLASGSGPTIVTVVGMGGVGKTTLARYVSTSRPVRDQFSVQFWLDASQPTSLDNQFLRLSRRFTGLSDTPEEARLGMYQLLLEQGQPYLLVLDDVSDFESIERFLPKDSNAAVLLTSRNRGLQSTANVLVDVFSLEEAVGYIRQSVGEQHSDAEHLAQAMGCHPLALAHACAYIRSEDVSISNFLQTLQTHRQQFLEEAEPVPNRSVPTSLNALWEATFRMLEESRASAMMLLNQLAYLASDAIPKALVDRLGSEEDVEILGRYSLVERRSGGGLSLHQLLRMVVCQRQADDSQALCQCLKRFSDAVVKEPVEEADRRVNWELLPHGQSLVEHYNKLVSPDREMQRACTRAYEALGSVWADLGKVAAAKKDHLRALELDIKAFGPEHPSVGNAYRRVGDDYQELGEYSNAIDCYEKELAARQAQNRLWQGKVYNKLGNAYLSLGNHEQSVRYLQMALGIAKQEEDLFMKVKVLGDFGNAYACRGDFDRAIDYHEQCLAIAERRGDNVRVAVAHGNLGIVYRAKDAWDSSERHFRTAVGWLSEFLDDIGHRPEAWGISFFEVQSMWYRQLKDALMAQGKSEEALVMADRAAAPALSSCLVKWSADIPASVEELRACAKRLRTTFVQYSVDCADPAILQAWIVDPSGGIKCVRLVVRLPTESLRSAPLEGRLFPRISARLRVASSLKGIPILGHVCEADPIASVVPALLDSFRRKRTITKVKESYSILAGLYNELIRPIEGDLPEKAGSRITFVADQALSRVPFAALMDFEGRYLIEKYTVTTAPSIGSLMIMDTRRRERSVAVPSEVVFFCDPRGDLPGAREEVRRVAMAYMALKDRSLVFVGDRATSESFRLHGPHARILHFACHGDSDRITSTHSVFEGGLGLAPPLGRDRRLRRTIDSNSNNASPVELEREGWLYAEEIQKLPLVAELAFLNCGTARFPTGRAGAIGLVDSFIAAGVDAVIATHWSLDDRTMGGLVKNFYGHLQVALFTKEGALRQMMLTAIREHVPVEEWGSYFYVGLPSAGPRLQDVADPPLDV